MIRQVDPFHWNFSHIYFFVVVRNHNIIDTSFLEFPHNSSIRLDKVGKNSSSPISFYVKYRSQFKKFFSFEFPALLKREVATKP